MKEIKVSLEENYVWNCPKCDSYNSHRVCNSTMCDVCGEEFIIKHPNLKHSKTNVVKTPLGSIKAISNQDKNYPSIKIVEVDESDPTMHINLIAMVEYDSYTSKLSIIAYSGNEEDYIEKTIFKYKK